MIYPPLYTAMSFCITKLERTTLILMSQIVFHHNKLGGYFVVINFGISCCEYQPLLCHVLENLCVNLYISKWLLSLDLFL